MSCTLFLVIEVSNFRMNEDGAVEISGTIDPMLLLKVLGKFGKSAKLLDWKFGECPSNLYMPEYHRGYRNYYGDNRYYSNGGNNYYEDSKYYGYGDGRHVQYRPNRPFRYWAYTDQAQNVSDGRSYHPGPVPRVASPYLESAPRVFSRSSPGSAPTVASQPGPQPESAPRVPSPIRSSRGVSCCRVM